MTANLVITDLDNSGVPLGNNEYDEEILAFAGADTFAVGTILARNASTLKLVICDPSESDGTEIPVAILPTEENRTGAGDNSIRALIGGKVNKNNISFDDATAITKAHIDELRDYGIFVIDVEELNNEDND